MRTQDLEQHIGRLGQVGYGLVLLPFLGDFLERGRLPVAPREWITELSVGILLVGYALVLRRALQRNIELNKSRVNLQRLIVHDLKNPVSNVLGAIATLQQGSPTEADPQPLLNVALNSCRQGLRLVDQILEIDRLELNEFPIAAKEFNVQQVLSECVSELRGPAGIKDVVLRWEESSPTPPLRSDPDLIRRSTMNLLSNALASTPSGGSIVVRHGYEKGRWLIEISDTGTGTAPDILESLARPKERGPAGNTPTLKTGKGIGLYFCRLAMDALKGDLRIKSEPQQGTTVFLSIPQLAQETA